jgi:hypothetical protein
MSSTTNDALPLSGLFLGLAAMVLMAAYAALGA